MGEKYIFTLRSTIRSEPRITQTKILISAYDYKFISSLDFLFSAEKDKGKKASKEKMQFYKSEMKGVEKHELITTDSAYWKFLDKFVETSEGWCNLKKK